MGRLVPNWLQAYGEYTAESEAPETYHLWTGLSVLASAVRRNVWLDQGIYLLYPNIFVILVAPPGKVGKSTVLRMGKKLLQKVEEVNLGPDSVTAEELVRQMGMAYNDGQSAMSIFSSELSSLIEPSGIKMLQILTDLYDCDPNPKGWSRATKTQGKDTIKNPVLNLLGATTPSWIAEGFPEQVISHGFTSRTIFVYEDQTRFANPFPDPADKNLTNALVADLKNISRIEGEFTWTEEARKMYADKYGDIRETSPEDHRIEGYHYRKRTHILKVAMLLSLADDDELKIRQKDIRAAIDLLEMVEENMPKTFSAVGKYEHAADLERIMADIYRHGGMTLAQITSRNYYVGDMARIKEILTTLVTMGQVRHRREGDSHWFVPARGATAQIHEPLRLSGDE